MKKQYRYQSKKFSAARRSLMLPHPRGEAESIASAFREISFGLDNLDEGELDEAARNWVEKIKELMDATGIDDPTDRGQLSIKAEQLTEDQKFELSRVLDELAHWFDRRFWEVH